MYTAGQKAIMPAMILVFCDSMWRTLQHAQVLNLDLPVEPNLHYINICSMIDSPCTIYFRLVAMCQPRFDKLTWLVLGGDPAVRSRRVEQFTAL